MRFLHEDNCCSYYRLEVASEVDKLDIPEEDGGFDFFHGLGIIGYPKAFKMWLRRFPRPILIIASEKSRILGWVYVEEWGNTSRDGRTIHVLRAIEVLPELRKSGIGFKLVILALKEITGYMITKPLTEDAEVFFKKIGFMESAEFRKPPLDLSKHPKYLILPIYKRDMLVKDFESAQTSGSSRT